MSSINRIPSSKVGSAILGLLLEEWRAILSIIHSIYAFVSNIRNDGIFEVLDYDDTLELLDSKGESAIFRRRVKVRFLQDNIIAFQDYVWGEGEQLVSYKIAPGKVVDTYTENGRWNILISLRETKSKGDIEEFTIERTVKNAFTKPIEWRQTEIWLNFHQIRLSVIFPQDRLCKRAILNERGSKRNVVLNEEHFHVLPDSRQVLTWEKKHPRRNEVYTLRWDW